VLYQPKFIKEVQIIQPKFIKEVQIIQPSKDT